jgi:CRP-like cAMP-binding protein
LAANAAKALLRKEMEHAPWTPRKPYSSPPRSSSSTRPANTSQVHLGYDLDEASRIARRAAITLAGLMNAERRRCSLEGSAERRAFQGELAQAAADLAQVAAVMDDGFQATTSAYQEEAQAASAAREGLLRAVAQRSHQEYAHAKLQNEWASDRQELHEEAKEAALKQEMRCADKESTALRESAMQLQVVRTEVEAEQACARLELARLACIKEEMEEARVELHQHSPRETRRGTAGLGPRLSEGIVFPLDPTEDDIARRETRKETAEFGPRPSEGIVVLPFDPTEDDTEEVREEAARSESPVPFVRKDNRADTTKSEYWDDGISDTGSVDLDALAQWDLAATAPIVAVSDADTGAQKRVHFADRVVEATSSLHLQREWAELEEEKRKHAEAVARDRSKSIGQRWLQTSKQSKARHLLEEERKLLHQDNDRTNRLIVDLSDDLESISVEEQVSPAVEAALERFLRESDTGAFRNMPKHTVSEMTRQLTKRSYTKDDVIFSQGDVGGEMFIVESGAMHVIVDGEILRVLRSCTIFGERSLLHEEKRTATIRVTTPTAVVWVMERETYEKVSQVRLKASIDALVHKGEPIFRNLSKSDIAAVMANCLLQRYHQDETVVRQGDSGQVFYVVESGTLLVTIDGRSIRTLQRGDYFGETALLTNAPRSATVTVKGDFAELWPVGRSNFVMMTQHRLRATISALKLKSPGIFKDVAGSEIQALMASATFEVHHQGATIIRQGDLGTTFFVVEQGQLRVTENGRDVRILNDGDYFGQVALLNEEPRTASVHVTSQRAELWAIHREQFLAVMHTLKGQKTRKSICGTRISFSEGDAAVVQVPSGFALTPRKSALDRGTRPSYVPNTTRNYGGARASNVSMMSDYSAWSEFSDLSSPISP